MSAGKSTGFGDFLCCECGKKAEIMDSDSMDFEDKEKNNLYRIRINVYCEICDEYTVYRMASRYKKNGCFMKNGNYIKKKNR